MPTYQYACTSCDERLEVVQSFSDPSLTVHEPGCGGPLRKVFGSVGVVFKGSGFYRTDSRKGVVEAGTPKGDSSSGESKGSDAGKSSDTGMGSDTGKSSDAGKGNGNAKGSGEASKPAAAPAPTPSSSTSKPAA